MRSFARGTKAVFEYRRNIKIYNKKIKKYIEFMKIIQYYSKHKK